VLHIGERQEAGVAGLTETHGHSDGERTIVQSRDAGNLHGGIDSVDRIVSTCLDAARDTFCIRTPQQSGSEPLGRCRVPMR